MNFLLGSAKAAPAEKKEPAALAKEWRRNLAKEVRSIDRDVRHSIVEDRLSKKYARSSHLFVAIAFLIRLKICDGRRRKR